MDKFMQKKGNRGNSPIYDLVANSGLTMRDAERLLIATGKYRVITQGSHQHCSFASKFNTAMRRTSCCRYLINMLTDAGLFINSDWTAKSILNEHIRWFKSTPEDERSYELWCASTTREESILISPLNSDILSDRGKVDLPVTKIKAPIDVPPPAISITKAMKDEMAMDVARNKCLWAAINYYQSTGSIIITVDKVIRFLKSLSDEKMTEFFDAAAKSIKGYKKIVRLEKEGADDD
jgi:hypothetical protein